MKSFYEKDNYTINDIKELIENEVEESIHLDFKRAEALDKTDRKRDDISKDVAAFANAEGGMIVYGIQESAHRASTLSYVDGDNFTKEWLEQVINSGVQRRISGLTIFPIRDGGDIKKTIYVVKIPKSIDAPHMSRDRRFYKRYNFESVAMEEYEVRQSYGRTVLSKLSVGAWGATNIEYDRKVDKFTLTFFATIFNDGDKVESQFKVNFYFINSGISSFSWETHQVGLSHHRVGEKLKITDVVQNPIYPQESIDCGKFKLHFLGERLDEICNSAKIEIGLLYPNHLKDERIKSDFNSINLWNSCSSVMNEQFYGDIPFPRIYLVDAADEKLDHKYFISLLPQYDFENYSDRNRPNTDWIGRNFEGKLVVQIQYNLFSREVTAKLQECSIANTLDEIEKEITTFLGHFPRRIF